MTGALSPEDRFLLRWCRPPGANMPPPSADAIPPPLDWSAITDRARANRVAPLLYRNLRDAESVPAVPAAALAALKRAYVENLNRVTLTLRDLDPLLARFRKQNVPVLVLRGLALGATVYGDPALRPFTDVDLLIRKADLAAARTCLLHAGFAPPPSALNPRYLERYHLHLAYRARPQGTVVELHWALDHRYVPFTIPYADLVARAHPLALESLRLTLPAPEDNLLCTLVHAVKHACFIPFVDDDERLRQRLLDAGCLIHFCDLIAHFRQLGPALDWARLGRLSEEWNIGREYGSGLRAVRALFPDEAAAARLPAVSVRTTPGERAAYRLLTRRGPDSGRVRSSALFRTVRGLDLIRYAWPGPAYLRHRYRVSHPWAVAGCAWLHPFRALGELALNAVALRAASGRARSRAATPHARPGP